MICIFQLYIFGVTGTKYLLQTFASALLSPLKCTVGIETWQDKYVVLKSVLFQNSLLFGFYCILYSNWGDAYCYCCFLSQKLMKYINRGLSDSLYSYSICLTENAISESSDKVLWVPSLLLRVLDMSFLLSSAKSISSWSVSLIFPSDPARFWFCFVSCASNSQHFQHILFIELFQAAQLLLKEWLQTIFSVVTGLTLSRLYLLSALILLELTGIRNQTVIFR